jgi:hypothetical protein
MLPGFKIMADGKQDDPNAVRTKKIEGILPNTKTENRIF